LKYIYIKKKKTERFFRKLLFSSSAPFIGRRCKTEETKKNDVGNEAEGKIYILYIFNVIYG